VWGVVASGWLRAGGCLPGCESHISLAKNHVAGYGSIMALILVDMIAKQIFRELGVDKVLFSLATSKIFFIRSLLSSSHWLPPMGGCSQ
jgi:hypothetical protein